MDSLSSLETYLETDLGDRADVELIRTPGVDRVLKRIVITPHNPDAMPMTVYGGRDEIPSVEFDDVGGFECAGNTRTAAGHQLTPLEELSVLISAVTTDGAQIACSRFRRRYLLLGDPTAQPQAYRTKVLQSWAPIHEHLPTMLTFLTAPDYTHTPSALLRLRAPRRFLSKRSARLP